MKIGIVLFEQVTQLDFTGPLQILSRAPGAEVILVAKTMDLVPTDTVLKVPPTATFDSCPELDILLVPGGHGVTEALADADLLDFVRRQAGIARYVTSVCTGALILGAAGLLKGKRATTHWAYCHLLDHVGAIHETARVVRDGNVITGGGVTAGLDFAFHLIAELDELGGKAVAHGLQLALEYDPNPPADVGQPSRAPKDLRDRIDTYYAEPEERLRAALVAVMAG